MLKEAIEKIVELSAPNIINVEGKSFLVEKDGSRATQIKPEPEFPDTLKIHSLDALVALIGNEFREDDVVLYVNAHSYNEVICYTPPLDTLYMRRGFMFDVEAKDIPGWEEKVELPFEEALIAIRTRFQHTPDTDYLLKLLSDITSGAKITYTDDGMATTVVQQKGIALQENQTIRPIITLKPYRTFQEIDQPASEFHIRVSERGIKFIEADGGMWKLTARHSIAEYLTTKLSDLPAAAKVIVTI